jgi:sugar phosphate isomerase/epimerase
MQNPSRRRFLQQSLGVAAAVASAPLARALAVQGDEMAFGLVTYLWGQDWDVPTLIANCSKSKVLGVELRTTHAHGVEPSLNEQQRRDVRARFADSPVSLVSLGSNERFDSPDPAALQKSIETTKAFLRLSHDVGSTGVKVKPDSFHKDVPREQTIEQIGKALNQVGAYGAGYGQEIRLEVHGKCAELPTIKAIMDIADHPNVGVCWNSNAQDLQGEGLEHNFRLVRDRFGATCHVRELDDAKYPYPKLFKLLVETDYAGWILLEARGKPADRVAALAEQRRLFLDLIANARKA